MLKTRFYALLPRAFLIVWGMWLLNRMWLPHQTGAAINRFMHCTVLDILLTFRQTMEWAVFYFNLSLSDEVIWIWILWLSWILWSIYTLTSSYVKVDGGPLYFPLENVQARLAYKFIVAVWIVIRKFLHFLFIEIGSQIIGHLGFIL